MNREQVQKEAMNGNNHINTNHNNNNNNNNNKGGNVASNLLSKVYKSYESLVLQNPAYVTYYESVIRAMLMFTPSVRDSEISTEAVYMSTGFISLLNDIIIKNYFVKHQKKLPFIPPDAQHLVLSTPGGTLSTTIQLFQSLIQNTQLFIEIICSQKFSPRVRWRAVFLIELVKAFLKIFLLLRTRETILVHQKFPERENAISSVPPLFFDPLHSQPLDLASPSSSDSNYSLVSENATKKSQQVLLPKRETILTAASRKRYRSSVPKDLMLVQAGEYMSVMRPLICLLAMYVFGRRSWFPWLLGVGIDGMANVCSRAGAGEKMNGMERAELDRRRMTMVYYLLKSPFFDTVILHQSVLKVIESLKGIPLLRIPLSLCWEMILSYSRFYFYTCGSDS